MRSLALSLLLSLLACTGSSDAPMPAPEAPPQPEAPAPAGPGDASDLAVPPAPEGGRPDVILVVIDTLRADHLGAYGHDRPTSPHFDALAAQSLVFERGYAQSGWTLASFSSLLTGQYPHQHRVARDAKDPARFGCLTPDKVTLAEMMGAAGYRTAAFVNNTFVAPEFGLKQGFEVYDFNGATNDRIRPASVTVERVLQWMDGVPEGEPVFTLVHFMEPHLDYAPSKGFAGTFTAGVERPEMIAPDKGSFFRLRELGQPPPPDVVDYMERMYDEEILAADAALGSLVDGLRARGRFDDAVVVVTADHGEEFWDHGKFEHGHALWSELTRVPFVVKAPGVAPARVQTLVEHVDLTRGLLTVAGAPVAPTVQGDDLFALAAAPTQPRASLQENCMYGLPCISVIDSTHRLVFSPVQGTGQVWAVDDQARDAERLQGEAQQAQGQRLMNLLSGRRGSLQPIEAAAGPKLLSFETFQQLAQLGYVDADEMPEESGVGRGCTGG